MSSVTDEDIEITCLQNENSVSQSKMTNENAIESIFGIEKTDQNDDITANTELLKVAEQPHLQTDNQAWFSLPWLFQLLTLPNLVFFVLDVCLPVSDIAMDIKVTYRYWSRSDFIWNETEQLSDGFTYNTFTVFGVAQVYSVGFIASVIILTLPSLSLMVDLVVKKDCCPTKLLKALLYPLHMVFEGVNCFLNPTNEEKRNKFQISKEHEILLEATLQIFVQCGILLFELLDSKTKDRIFMRERKFEIMSIVISVLTLCWGICSLKMNMKFKNPDVTLKLKLFIRSTIDIVPRIAILLSVIVLSLDWMYGVLVSTMLICLLLLGFPFFGFLYNKFLHGTSSFSDRTNIFLPVTIFESESLERIRSSKRSRIENKMVSFMLMMLIIFTEALVIWEIIPVSSTHIWFDCHNRKTEIQLIMMILWGTVSLCISFSSIEIIYFYFTNTTWIEFIDADDKNCSDDDALNDIQEEAIVHKSRCCSSDLTFIKSFSVDKIAGLALIITALITITLFTASNPDPQYYQRPTNFTDTELVNFLDELSTYDKNGNFCKYLNTKSQSEVVYTMHEIIGKREYDELVIAMVSCKPTPSTLLKYQDKDDKERYRSALIKAIRNGASTEIVYSLLKYYPEEINASDNYGWTPILYAASNNEDLIPNLIADGAMVTDTDYGGQNILHKSSVNREFIGKFPSLMNKGDCTGDTPLHQSCQIHSIEIVKTMLDNGGNPNAMDTGGASSKDYCCRSCGDNGCVDKCKLIQGGSPPKDLCQQNPWNVLVVQDVFNPDQIKHISKDCCSSCKNKECTLACEIIERGYTSKEICSASHEFILKLEEYLDNKMHSIVKNYRNNCKKTCKSEHCINNIKLLDGWFKQGAYVLH